MKNQEELQLFSRPLILGASISAGYGTKDGGIGAVLARMINPSAQITNKAISGATSLQSTSHLDLHSFDPSIVLGLDLFFWDAVRGSINAKFESNTRKLVTTFAEKNIPLILGKVPVLELPLIGGYGNTLLDKAKKVNDLLESVAFSQKNCLLYDPVPCFLSMGFSGENYFSDGLHLNSTGNQYCADYFIKEGKHRELSFEA